MAKVGLVGAGLIGRAWAIVFARAGFDVALWDADEAAMEAAHDYIAPRIEELRAARLIEDPTAVLARIRTARTLRDAVQDAVHVQENTPEAIDTKLAIFAELDRLAGPQTVLASSTSSIPASAFTESLPGRARCLVAHPVNPPYIVPVVELCGAPWTTPETITRTRDLMAKAGQVPVIVRREIEGFVVNRLQGALLNEAFRLVEDGVISADDLDSTIKNGLGLRWAIMGPFETIDLNAPGGIADYCRRYGPMFHDMAKEQADPRAWSAALVASLEAVRRAAVPRNRLPARQAWRDRRLMALVAHKRDQDAQESE